MIEDERVRWGYFDAVKMILRVMDRLMICELLAWSVGMVLSVFKALEII